MTQERLHVSPRGLERLHAELEQRIAELRAICAARDAAFELSGDGWHDNPHFNKMQQDEAAKSAQIAQLRHQIRTAVVFEPVDGRRPKHRVALGALVRVRLGDVAPRCAVYEITAWGDTDLEVGRIAYNTPLARQLLGLEPGDELEFRTADGVVHGEVVELLQQRESSLQGPMGPNA